MSWVAPVLPRRVACSTSWRTPTFADRAHQRFEPTVMAHDLATSIEMLSAAIDAIPTDGLDQSDAERLHSSLDASFEALRQIRRHLRQGI